jgi:hypothetical protein
MFSVSYRCPHREYWYDDTEYSSLPQAIGRAQLISRLRRVPARVEDGWGRVVYRTF